MGNSMCSTEFFAAKYHEVTSEGTQIWRTCAVSHKHSQFCWCLFLKCKPVPSMISILESNWSIMRILLKLYRHGFVYEKHWEWTQKSAPAEVSPIQVHRTHIPAHHKHRQLLGSLHVILLFCICKLFSVSKNLLIQHLKHVSASWLKHAEQYMQTENF